MIVQVAPTTIMSPPRMKIEKFVFRSPKSQRLIGSTNQRTSARPAAVCTRPVGQAERAEDGHEARG